MKYRKVKSVIAAMLIGAMAVGCGGAEKTESDAGSNEKAEEEVKEVSEAEKVKEIIAKVNEAYAKEKVAGGKSTTVVSYDDNSKSESANTWVLDRNKQIYQNMFEFDGYKEPEKFETKEKDGCYSYIATAYRRDDKGNAVVDKWAKYKQEMTEENPVLSYEQKEKNIITVYSEDEEKKLNVKYYDEGTETVDGIEAVKIKVESNKVSGEKAVTKEAVIKEKGWKEETVDLADGLSEMIDDYVEAAATLNKIAAPVSETIWIDAKTYRVLKRESQEIISNEEIELYKKMRPFENIAGFVGNLQMYIETGSSKEEAVKRYESDIKTAKKEGYYGYDKVQKEITFLEQYLYDDESPKLNNLPKEYEEITQEQYMSGEF